MHHGLQELGHFVDSNKYHVGVEFSNQDNAPYTSPHYLAAWQMSLAVLLPPKYNISLELAPDQRHWSLSIQDIHLLYVTLYNTTSIKSAHTFVSGIELFNLDRALHGVIKDQSSVSLIADKFLVHEESVFPHNILSILINILGVRPCLGLDVLYGHSCWRGYSIAPEQWKEACKITQVSALPVKGAIWYDKCIAAEVQGGNHDIGDDLGIIGYEDYSDL